MAIFVIGGTGFIGIRVIPLLIARGETVVCMDINPNAPALSGLGDKVSVIRGDVTQFDDVYPTWKPRRPTGSSTCPTTSARICRRTGRPN